jgi:hypothetical protein
MEKIIGKDLTDMLKEAVLNKTVEQKSTFYTGKIVNNKDPEKLGRCQIRVYGVFNDSIPDGDLPWAIPDFTFTGSTMGSFIVPEDGTIVNVYFDNDDLYLPKYTTKVLQKSSLSAMSAEYDTDYPNTMVFFETENGDYFKINRKTLEAEFRHASGIIVTMDKDGNINLNATAPENATVSLSVSGSVKLTASKDITLSAAGSINLQTAGGDSAAWLPNILSTCPYTGLPHGGKSAGISSLKGGSE